MNSTYTVADAVAEQRTAEVSTASAFRSAMQEFERLLHTPRVDAPVNDFNNVYKKLTPLAMRLLDDLSYATKENQRLTEGMKAAQDEIETRDILLQEAQDQFKGLTSRLVATRKEERKLVNRCAEFNAELNGLRRELRTLEKALQQGSETQAELRKNLATLEAKAKQVTPVVPPAVDDNPWPVELEAAVSQPFIQNGKITPDGWEPNPERCDPWIAKYFLENSATEFCFAETAPAEFAAMKQWNSHTSALVQILQHYRLWLDQYGPQPGIAAALENHLSKPITTEDLENMDRKKTKAKA